MESRNDDKAKKIEELLNSTQEEEQKKEGESKSKKKESLKKKLNFSIDINSIKSALSGLSLSAVLMAFFKNKKLVTAVSLVAVIGVGLYIYEAFIKPPAYKPLPAINVKVHKPVIHKPAVFAKKTKSSKASVKKVASKVTSQNLPLPIEKAENWKQQAKNFNKTIEKRTSAIVEATKEQEQKLFDIFKIEPEEEYKIDRLIDLSKKQNEFLTVELSILKKKKLIDTLLGELQKRRNKESAMQEKIDELISEVANLKSQIRKEKNKNSTAPQIPTPQIPQPAGINQTNINQANPFSFSGQQMQMQDYQQELKNLTVGIIYNYKNRKKIAVVDDNGRIFRVSVGSRVTDHFIVKSIQSGGIVVALSPKGKGIFIPLSFGLSNKNKVKFGVVNHLKNGNSESTYQPQTTITPPPATPPAPIQTSQGGVQ